VVGGWLLGTVGAWAPGVVGAGIMAGVSVFVRRRPPISPEPLPVSPEVG
jgi:hypothetical protein